MFLRIRQQYRTDEWREIYDNEKRLEIHVLVSGMNDTVINLLISPGGEWYRKVREKERITKGPYDLTCSKESRTESSRTDRCGHAGPWGTFPDAGDGACSRAGARVLRGDGCRPPKRGAPECSGCS